MTHCDEYAENYDGNPDARWFILINRLPATLRILARSRIPDPTLYATWNGKRVRVVMASRMGDLGITEDLAAETGYQHRVSVDDLAEFSATPWGLP